MKTRPATDRDVQQALIDAARELFLRQSYDKVSIRLIAQQAGANSAMIHYYFGDKAGLFEHMLLDTVAPILEELKSVSVNSEPDDLSDLMMTYYRIFGKYPDLPKLIARVLIEENAGPQFDAVMKLAQHISERTRHILFERFRERGKLKADVDPDLSRLSLMSLLMFPFLAPPAILKLHGIQLDSDFLEALGRHNFKLLQNGILQQGARQ